MSVEIILLIFVALLCSLNAILFFTKKNTLDVKSEEKLLKTLKQLFFDIENSVKNEFSRTRIESNEVSKSQREELTHLLNTRFDGFIQRQNEINKETELRIKEIKNTVEKQLGEIRQDNEKQLNAMRHTVDEKLEKTLNTRLVQSFETVGKQLKSVQEGLGEMKNLASDVGGLKKVLSNVKARGSFGELQLSMLLEQILAPSQYEVNVKTKKGSNTNVEFAIKLPGKDDNNSIVWLPIDSKFPKDVYQKLQEADDEGDIQKIQIAQKELVNAIKKMAKDINEKYIDPPNTTDFGIMFLPFEGIYAEVVKQPELLEVLQRDYKIIVTGPTTLAAILNSLQMGFKTLAIQKRSSEVWEILSSVKKEFDKFGGLLEKAQKNIKTGLGQLDDVMGVRTRAIQKQLDNVSVLENKKDSSLLVEIETNNEISD